MWATPQMDKENLAGQPFFLRGLQSRSLWFSCLPVFVVPLSPVFGKTGFPGLLLSSLRGFGVAFFRAFGQLRF